MKFLPNELIINILVERKNIKQKERFKKNFNNVIEVIKEYGVIMKIIHKKPYINILEQIQYLEQGLEELENNNINELITGLESEIEQLEIRREFLINI